MAGIGPLIFGPLSDNFGRKPVVYFGFILFLLASFICVSAETIEYMIAGRILQGIGLSAPRTISIAIIRDQYQGDPMARIMSFVTVVFLLVPIVAPAIGKLVLDHFDWQSIFLMQLWCSGAVAIWFWKRQPETLDPNNKRTLRVQDYVHGLGEVFKQPRTMGYTLISGLVFGSFMVQLKNRDLFFRRRKNPKNHPKSAGTFHEFWTSVTQILTTTHKLPKLSPRSYFGTSGVQIWHSPLFCQTKAKAPYLLATI